MTAWRLLFVMPALAVLAGSADAQSGPNDFRRPPLPAVDTAAAPVMALGKVLFFDRRLSKTGSVACASCHLPSLGGADRVARPFNDGGTLMARRTLPTVNLTEMPRLLGDGRFSSLETLIPAAFQRSLVSGRAPFDCWVGGDDTAIGAGAKQGFALFTGRAGCSACRGGWTFSDGGFHDTGLPDTGDLGRGKQVPNSVKMRNAFRTPGLRDVALQPPYRHDGSLPTLTAVVDFYASGDEARPSRADEIKPLTLSPEEHSALVAFLPSLTGRQDAEFTVPVPP